MARKLDLQTSPSTLRIVVVAASIATGIVNAAEMRARPQRDVQATAEKDSFPRAVAESRPAFDVASIKPNKSVDGGGGRSNLDQRGGHVAITKFSLRMLMAQAYDLPSLSDAFDRIFGTPNWADSEYFDIKAQAEGNPGTSQKLLMLQSLLSERFKLAIHHENRQRPVYALVMIKPGNLGSQLHPHTDDTACQAFLAGLKQPLLQAGPGARPTRYLLLPSPPCNSFPVIASLGGCCQGTQTKHGRAHEG